MSKTCSPKEKAVYEAVIQLFWEGVDLNKLTVSEITGKAGIGKGTAYEYFSDKEEMIARALLYHMSELEEAVSAYLKTEIDFYHKINKLLLKMEEKVAEANCFFRMVHVMTEHSSMNQRLRSLAKKEQEETGKESGVEAIIKKLILEECSSRGKIEKEKLYYLINSTISRIFCYGMILNDPCHAGEFQPELMREMVCNSICREVKEMTAK